MSTGDPLYIEDAEGTKWRVVDVVPHWSEPDAWGRRVVTHHTKYNPPHPGASRRFVRADKVRRIGGVTHDQDFRDLSRETLLLQLSGAFWYVPEGVEARLPSTGGGSAIPEVRSVRSEPLKYSPRTSTLGGTGRRGRDPGAVPRASCTLGSTARPADAGDLYTHLDGQS